MKCLVLKFCSVLLFFLVCCYAMNTQAKNTAPANITRPTVYYINGIEVKEAEFGVFRKSLQEIKDTNLCKKTRFGGTTVYEAIDSTGVRYMVRLEDGAKVNKARIDKIE